MDISEDLQATTWNSSSANGKTTTARAAGLRNEVLRGAPEHYNWT